jgi:hypothetical protein
MKETKIKLSEFKSIPGFKSYLINKKGQVYSLKRKIFLKPQICRYGYITYVLPYKNKQKNKTIRQLLLKSFKDKKILKNLKKLTYYKKNKILTKSVERLNIKENNIVTFIDLISLGYVRIPGFLNYLLTPENEIYSLIGNRILDPSVVRKNKNNVYCISSNNKSKFLSIKRIKQLIQDQVVSEYPPIGEKTKSNVRRHKYTNKWMSSIGYKESKQIYLGLFDTKEEAELAYYNKFIELRGYAPWKM